MSTSPASDTPQDQGADVRALLKKIGLKNMIDTIGAKAILAQIPLAELVKYVDTKELLQHVKLKTLVDAAGAKAVLEHIRVSDIAAHIGVDALLKAIAPADVVRFFGSRRLLEEIPLDQLVHALSTEKVLEHFKLKTLVAVAGADKVLENIRVPDIVNYVGADELLRAIPFPQIMATLGTKRVLDAIPANVLIDRIGTKELLAHIPVKKLVDAAGPQNVIHHLTVDERLTELDMSDHRVLEHLLADPKALAKLLEDDRAIRASLSNEKFRKRSRGLDAYRVAGRLPYPLPVPVVSFPRAGSNFMQMVLQASSGLRCQSIYVPLDDPAEATLTVKTHGPSPEYLHDEWRRHFPDRAAPTKAIVLRRDPRDQMISFLEYTKSRRQCEIDPGHFLDEVDYFYASTIDREFHRRLYLGGLTVAEAFRTFVQSWTQKPVDGIETLHLRYEDLLVDPQAAFKRIFDFLALDCNLAADVLSNKISQYGDTGGRERGIARGWEKHYTKYAPLIDHVHTKLAGELTALGYEAK